MSPSLGAPFCGPLGTPPARRAAPSSAIASPRRRHALHEPVACDARPCGVRRSRRRRVQCGIAIRRVDPRRLGLLPRRGRLPGAGRAHRRRRAGGALHAQAPRRPLAGRRRSPFCLRAGGHRARASSTSSASTTSRSSSSSACSTTYAASAPWGLRSFWRAMPLWLKQKLWIPRSDPQGITRLR